ncbi:GDP-mannose 4,6-dehydratase [Nocardioides sp. L-11A]|uniref:GDP-mannose 4,6-dehydratase n=1 Tax=Nocardioides sp. L-11A TaxID=3043848 RepID=UPI00249C8C8B|nr:GDP-mannose 4,6-dehydratase [Nocardioides sp. L-11A]
MTRALITGITGQDGGYLAEQLLADGIEVFGLAADDGWIPDGVTRLQIDLRSNDEVSRAVADVAPDEVYHLAGLSSVARSWEATELTMDINFLGLVRVVEALREHAPKARIVHASSSEIFTEEVAVQDESTPIRPRNPYGLSKAVAHEAVQYYRDLGVWISSVILFNHESVRRPDTFVTRRITKGVAQIARGAAGPLTLGNIDARRDWGHALDVVRALQLVVRHDHPDDFVIATGVSRSVADFVAAAFAHVGIANWRDHIRVDDDLLRPTDAPDRRGDASKAARELGWTPTISFESMVAEMVDADLARLDQKD